MSHQILISIIIPCYNLGKYLKSCLDSIAKQLNYDVEYIFVDDGSTDDTLTILDKFCLNKKNCNVIHQVNAGVSAARNAALKHCSGEYIYLLDGDDILTDDAVESMLDIISKDRTDAILSSVIIKTVDKEKKFHIQIPPGTYTPGKLYNSCKVFPTMPKLLYRRQIIEQEGLKFDTTLKVGEVYDFTIRFLNYASKVAVVHNSFFYYVMRNSSATHHPDFNKDMSVLKTIECYYKYGRKFKKYASFNNTAFKMLMSFTYNKYVKLKLQGVDVEITLNKLFSNSIVNYCIRRVAFAKGSSIKERGLALYVLSTRIIGYKILARLL